MKFFLLIISTALASRLGAQSADAFSATKIRTLWTDQTNTVWSVSGQSRLIVTRENAVRFIGSAKDSFDIPIVAIADDVTGAEWVGKKTDLYVETGSGMVGISLPYSGVLIWDRGVMRPAQSKETIDGLVKRFETKADLKQLIEIYDPVTDLRPILNPSFFSNDVHFATGGARISRYQLTGGELELEMENRSRTHTATVWIDFKKRSVVKAIEDGEQIIPQYIYRGFLISPEIMERHGFLDGNRAPDQAIQAYLATNGVQLSLSPSQINFSDLHGWIVFQATSSDLDEIRAILSLPPPVPNDPKTGMPVFPEVNPNWPSRSPIGK